MENWRNRFRARSRIHLSAALVLVSVGANPLSNRHDPRLPSPELDLHARDDWLAKRVLRNKRRMAAFRNRAPWISSHKLGRQAPFWKCFLRRGEGELRDRGSNWQFCI